MFLCTFSAQPYESWSFSSTFILVPKNWKFYDRNWAALVHMHMWPWMHLHSTNKKSASCKIILLNQSNVLALKNANPLCSFRLILQTGVWFCYSAHWKVTWADSECENAELDMGHVNHIFLLKFLYKTSFQMEHFTVNVKYCNQYSGCRRIPWKVIQRKYLFQLVCRWSGSAGGNGHKAH